MGKFVALALAAGVAGAVWWRKNPSACPYSQRFLVEVPHPLITRSRLRETLTPQPGERILEIGPGTGYYTLDLAEWIGPSGGLDIFDIQQEMLDHTMGQVEKRGVENVTATQGDARSLPYGDDAFDAVVLTTVLGEIPDQQVALAEIARVLRPGGRLVVGEILFDPHFVSPGALRERAEAAGMRLERRNGTTLGYFARFVA